MASSLPPSAAHVRAMSLIDGCPTACGNTEAPTSAYSRAIAGDWVCAYRCADCGETWQTSWKV